LGAKQLTDAVARGLLSKLANSSLMGFPSSFSMVPRTCTQEKKIKINCVAVMLYDVISIGHK
jgi:hypothetical protein